MKKKDMREQLMEIVFKRNEALQNGLHGFNFNATDIALDEIGNRLQKMKKKQLLELYEKNCKGQWNK